jgi:hypothetical protein
MTHTTVDKRAAFGDMHDEGCFILPNPMGESSEFAALPGANFCQYVANGVIATANKPPYFIESIGSVETARTAALTPEGVP